MNSLHMDTTTYVVTACLALGVICAVYVAYETYRVRSFGLKDIPGPSSEFYGLGNMRQVYQSEVGEIDFRWQEQFGGVMRLKGPFGEDRLWITDVKALHHIYQVAGYNFAKELGRREVTRSIGGQGILWADGDIHKRHRKIVSPAFGIAETRAILPVFRGCIEKVTSKWKDILNETGSEVINVNDWLARVTLDAIGEAGFDTNFGALDNAESEFVRSYHNLLACAFGVPTKLKLFIIAASPYLPYWLLDLIYDYFPGEGFARARQNRRVATQAAKDLVESKIQEMDERKPGRDILSLLVKANRSADKNNCLSNMELIAQMRILILAGHDTTANTLTFAFLELAKYPHVQTKLRQEIRATIAAVRARGGQDLTHNDLEGCIYLNAFIKEVLRFHPVSYNHFRQSLRDDVLPLYNPITTISGKVITEIPIPRGLVVVVSIAACNRDKTVWGEDAHEFKPERWLKPKVREGPNIGVYSNLMTFSGGQRACVGYRFALMEMQVFLAELLNHFEFDMTDEATRIKRQASLVMVATVKGQEEKGVQMPLRVRFAPLDEH